MAAVNYYYGLKRGADNNPGTVVVGTSTAGTAVDVEVRVQINDGSNATGIDVLGVVLNMEKIENFLKQRGITASLGTNIPAS